MGGGINGGNYYNSAWDNCVLLYNGTTVTSYLNGSQVASTSMSSFVNSGSQALWMGADRSALFDPNAGQHYP